MAKDRFAIHQGQSCKLTKFTIYGFKTIFYAKLWPVYKLLQSTILANFVLQTVWPTNDRDRGWNSVMVELFHWSRCAIKLG